MQRLPHAQARTDGENQMLLLTHQRKVMYNTASIYVSWPAKNTVVGKHVTDSGYVATIVCQLYHEY